MNASKKVDKIQNDEINLLEENRLKKKIVLVTSHREKIMAKI